MLAEEVVSRQLEDWLRLSARANAREPVAGIHQEAGRQGGIVSGVIRRSRVAEARAAGQPSPYLRGHKAECACGHKLSGPNLRIRTDGSYICRICARRDKARSRARRQAQAT